MVYKFDLARWSGDRRRRLSRFDLDARARVEAKTVLDARYSMAVDSSKFKDLDPPIPTSKAGAEMVFVFLELGAGLDRGGVRVRGRLRDSRRGGRSCPGQPGRIIHDEFAEWMMMEQYANAVSDVVGRLGVKARAAGISLVFPAQRPDANVMPMQLRANLGNRLVLRVDGEGTSEIALGEKGAERLLGKGHLAAKLEGEPSLCFAQVPFVESNFLAGTVEALKSAG